MIFPNSAAAALILVLRMSSSCSYSGFDMKKKKHVNCSFSPLLTYMYLYIAYATEFLKLGLRYSSF